MSAQYRSQIHKCIVTGFCPVDLHHVKTQGSGGTDEEWNLMPLDRLMHTELHQIGLRRFADKYPTVRKWLIGHGWEFDVTYLKWKHAQAI